MISIRLVGGLCNQMFQYAFGRSLQRHDVRYFDQCGQYGYQLGNFNTKVTMVAGPEGQPHSESTLLYDPSEQSPADPSALYGYWQCEKYFLNVESELRAELTLRNTPSPQAQQWADGISSVNSAFVHIRRGDYTTWAKESHGTLPYSYYLQAANHIAESVSNPHFFVFSDDTDWATRRFRLPYPTTVLGNAPHEDLWLMSKCKHAVIANSSFSWWGAWLNPNKERVVVAPQQWFAQGNENARDICPARWLRI